MMRKHLTRALILFAAVTLAALPAAAAMYWPTASWTTATPASVGWDSTDLATAASYAGSNGSTGLVVVVNGKIIQESYWSSWTTSSTCAWYSASKTMTAMMVGMAEADGDLALSDDMYDYFTSLNYLNGEGDTVWHHLTMTSGLNAACDDFDATPGTDWTYNTDAYRMLFYVIEQATGEDMDDYAADRLWTPIAAQNMSWAEAASPTSINPTQKKWMIGSTRDMARHGLLMLREGVWNGTELINWEYLDDLATQSQALNESYGYLTWLGGYDSFVWTDDTEYEGDLTPDAPGDTFMAIGTGLKTLYVIPSLNCVIARLGADPEISWEDPADSFVNQLVMRVVAAAPADGTAPSTPSNPAVTAGDGYVLFDWDHNTDSDIAGYEVFRATDGYGPYSRVREPIINLDAFNDTTVANGTTYYYKVRAVDTSGNTSGLTASVWATPTAGGGCTPATEFSDDFEDGDVNGWTTSGTVAAASGAAYSGSYGARIRGGGSMYQVVDMSDYDSVNLKYDITCALLDAGEYVYVQWSTDGSSWTTVESYSNNGTWAVRDQSLGAGAAVSTLYVRFLNNAGGYFEVGDVDNVELVGNCD